ncbi:MAG: hypothetical protein NZ772_00130 [Cyanobacteria bacterium]|nr:hypothetical protein [Cyanobacteriota bacterium]MDW8199613.1 hypothetical protein [Cyanobacteriota bacterium SKYGB_h_bin112]
MKTLATIPLCLIQQFPTPSAATLNCGLLRLNILANLAFTFKRDHLKLPQSGLRTIADLQQRTATCLSYTESPMTSEP